MEGAGFHPVIGFDCTGVTDSGLRVDGLLGGDRVVGGEDACGRANGIDEADRDDSWGFDPRGEVDAVHVACGFCDFLVIL